MVDPVADRLAYGDLRSRHRGQACTQLLQDRVVVVASQLQPRVDLGGVYPLGVLIELGSTGTAGGLHDRRMGQKGLLNPPSERVGLVEGGAGHCESTDHERAFLELRKKGTAEERQDS